MKTIKIAPSLNEVTLNKNVVSTEFNNMKISYVIPEDKYTEASQLVLRQNFSMGIALSSKLWFLEDLLNRHFGWDGKLTVTSLKTGEVLYGNN